MSDNGILSRIPGEHVAGALQLLPPAVSAKEEVAEVQYDVPGIGRVRFTADRLKSKRGKTVRYFWSMSKAELLP